MWRAEHGDIHIDGRVSTNNTQPFSDSERAIYRLAAMGNDYSFVSSNSVNGNVLTNKCNVAEFDIVEDISDTLLQPRENAM